jgi:hypothetical protein
MTAARRDLQNVSDSNKTAGGGGRYNFAGLQQKNVQEEQEA